ncbi:MAG: Xaa-Pro peptidase family protein [Propionibacteriaceae bacterium]|jgi:Xaa-Pro aminopeptidase|nr:Xaa-Pro peptidase family protein [Propionibacteriaceae bacterium]
MTQLHEDRLARAAAALGERGLDVLVVTGSSDLKYLTGYGVHPDERFQALILAATGERFFIGNELYRLQLADKPVGEVRYWSDGGDPFALLRRGLADRHVAPRRIALEDAAPAAFTLPVQALYPDAEYSLASAVLSPLREIKDAAEIAAVAEACRRAEAALTATIARGAAWVGHTEAEFGAELSRQLAIHGAPGSGIVAVGPNAAVAHHETGDTPIAWGHVLLVDYVAEFDGYHSDQTRTFHFGEPTSEYREIYQLVREANEKAEAVATAGHTLGEVDEAARDHIAAAGYGAFFTHRTGHGLGLDVHEGFSVMTGETRPVTDGQVFSIEPGIYLEGRTGVRLENLVAIEQGKARRLHALTHDLQVVE